MSDVTRFFFRLTDSNNDAGSFIVDIDEDDEFCQSDIDNELSAETVRLDIYDADGETCIVSIDGNGWRDIDAADAIEDFVRNVLIDGDDIQSFLDDLAAELDVDEPGQVL